MIIYYGSYSTTDGKEYLIGYEEGNPNTGNVVVKQINGENEIEKGKKILLKYKSIIKNKLEKSINLKKLYYEQFERKV